MDFKGHLRLSRLNVSDHPPLADAEDLVPSEIDKAGRCDPKEVAGDC